MLRHGIENDVKSLAAISFIFLQKDYSIKNVLEHIKNKLTVDNILLFHNGNIPNVFYKEDELMDVDLDQYKDYTIYTKLYKEGDDNIQLRKVINGYHRFIKYLFDSSSTIDYTYLWDMVYSGIYKTKSSIHKYDYFER